jgi:DNA repair protein RecO (recombination protein O)
MRSFRTEGIIIKRRNFGEADRIITVFTRDHGKLHIKASGVRKITSRRSGQIELLNHAILGLYKGNGFPILTEAKMVEEYSPIKSDLDKIGLAYHLCELVDGLCPENQELREVYVLLKDTLGRLASSVDDTLVIIHEFEVELLSLLGYWNPSTGSGQVDLRDAPAYIETIIERKLKSRKIFSKLQ